MIRPANVADAGAIATLWNPYIRDTAVTFNAVEKSPADVEAMIDGRARLGHATFVAEAEGLLGFASYAQFRGGVGYRTCMEHSILLAPAARGRGAGRQLVTALCDHAARAGAHQMIAGVSAENPDGLAFHSRMGFAEIARVPEAGFKFGRFIDLVLMQKFL
ncbi:GNAT family N-acetyltransferase [Tabrizicola sp.]|uniref:GNAT family N-acetyltransferase n=1 Tax=Tabrizicola sp. TaxID=2005166 RepID=UPI00260A4A5C|nr:GNAT family N-acetyltransferase [Tabrizicola sp.]MDM7932142.1 N-acetyltransferase family protein [Tabrizicola sp.]